MTIDSRRVERDNWRVLEMIILLVRALALACRGHHELVLENLALRQQLHAVRRTGTRPHLRRRDRLFWIVLAQKWRGIWRRSRSVRPRRGFPIRRSSRACCTNMRPDVCGKVSKLPNNVLQSEHVRRLKDAAGAADVTRGTQPTGPAQLALQH